MRLLVNRLTNNAKLPSFGSEFAAGADLYAVEDVTIPPNSRKLVGTGIAVEIQAFTADEHDRSETFYLRIAPRSGLSVKHSVDIAAGVVDSDYRGEIYVCVVNNHLTCDFVVNQGDRIAQLIMERCDLFKIVDTHDATNALQKFHTDAAPVQLTNTKRGTGGFGSTGLNTDGKLANISDIVLESNRDATSSNCRSSNGAYLFMDC